MSTMKKRISSMLPLMALSLPLFSTTAALTCMEPKRKITIEIKTDSYGADTSWEFKVQNGRVLATNDRVYGSNEIDTTEICIKKGKLYEFTVRDKYGDGMCCHYGNGSYKIKTESSRTEDGEEIILYGGRFQEKETTHLINTTSPLMSDRDHLWLEAHNIRRKLWHNHYNTEYVPLQYSESLVAEAQIWAEFLLDSCKDGMYHDPARVYGENVASNAGMGTWAEQRTPDQVLARFVEDEVDDPWPANGHLTQALWRASRYVGCAETHTFMTEYGKAECHVQVCRYAITGNCNMNHYISSGGKEKGWLEPMLEDANFCGPICPLDGCKVETI